MINPRDPNFGLKVTQHFENMRNAQIGHICRQWAGLEDVLALTISSLLRMDRDTAYIVTNGLDILPRANMAYKLAVHLKSPPDAIGTLKDVRTALQNRLLDRRNRAIHGYRVRDPADFTSDLVTMRRGKGAGATTKQDHLDLQQLGLDIAYVTLALVRTLQRCGVFDASTHRPARIMAANASRKMGPRESMAGS